MFCAVCAFLLRVGESPHTLEACPLHELYEFLEVFLCLTREANEQCCAQMQTRHLLADALYELHCLRLSNMAMHTCEHIVGDVLQSDVEILANVRLLTNNVKQFKRELVRISVVQTNPLHTLYICDVRDKVGDMTFAVDVHSVVCQFLSDNLELLHATCHQFAYFLKYLLLRTADVLTSDNWYSTISTTAVATLANLYVGIVMRRSDMASTRACRLFGLAEVGKQLLEVELTIVLIHLRNFLFELLLIALRETTHHEEFAYLSLLLCLNEFKDGVYALLLCVFNEAACIDNNNFALDALRIVGAMISSLPEECHQLLAVDKVL